MTTTRSARPATPRIAPGGRGGPTRRTRPSSRPVSRARRASASPGPTTGGPGRVRFDPQSTSVEGGRGGQVETTVTFTEPGTHVLRAYADDSVSTTPIDVTVTVQE